MLRRAGSCMVRAVTTVMTVTIVCALVVTVSMFLMSAFGIDLPFEDADISTLSDFDFENNPYYTNDLGIERLNNGYYYEQLDEGLQQQYEYIVYELMRVASADTKLSDGDNGAAITLHGYRHDEDTVNRLFLAVYNDHPELFFLRTGYAFSYSGTVATMDWRFCMDLEERKEAQQRLTAVLEELESGCLARSPYERERYYHDALLARCVYDTETAEENVGDLQFALRSTPYAALCEGRAICGGYARAMHWLLAKDGIKVTTLSNTDHAWNMVWIDGEPYHLDATWNDAEEDMLLHSYFNVTDEDLLAGRALADETVAFPEATAVSANYFHREGLYISSLSDGSLTQAIRRQLEAGQTQLELRFSPSVFEEAMRYIESGEIFEQFGFLDESEEVERWKKISFVTDRTVHSVLLKADGI